jgi:hypothetical protein
MVRSSARKPIFLAATALSLGLAGCAQTPFGPTVQVMPGPGKSFDTFVSDQSTCKYFASDQVKGQADVANNQAVGAAVVGTLLGAGLGAATGAAFGDAGAGAAIGAGVGVAGGTGVGGSIAQNAQFGIQQQYDNAFAQCMYSKGNQVPGYAPQYALEPPPTHSRPHARARSHPVAHASEEVAATPAAPAGWVAPVSASQPASASASASGWVAPAKSQ